MNHSNQVVNVHVTSSQKVGVRSIVPVGVTVKVDINPIARYSYATKIYSYSYNQIEGIELIQVFKYLNVDMLSFSCILALWRSHLLLCSLLHDINLSITKFKFLLYSSPDALLLLSCFVWTLHLYTNLNHYWDIFSLLCCWISSLYN